MIGRMLAVGTLAMLSVVGCRAVPPFANTHGSAEALASAVLDAVARGDRARLDALALGEQEFKDHVWPELPAARPERNLPFSYVWGDLRQKSTAALSRTLAQHGGRHYQLQQIVFDGPTTNYGRSSVHRKARFVVRESAAGESLELRLCGSFFEMRGEWKVFSFIVDE